MPYGRTSTAKDELANNLLAKLYILSQHGSLPHLASLRSSPPLYSTPRN
jgi:hypothetical protein